MVQSLISFPTEMESLRGRFYFICRRKQVPKELLVWTQETLRERVPRVGGHGWGMGAR